MMRRSLADQIKTGLGKNAPVFSILVLCGLVLGSPRAAQAQTWTGSVSDLWNNASNWSSPSTVPNSSTAVVVIDSTTNNPVMLNIDATVGTLSMGTGTTLDMTGVNLGVAGGSISNAGQINVGTSGGAGYLYVEANMTLSGSGTLTLDNAGSYIRADGFGGTGTTLTNQSTITGQGYIYDVNLANSATVNANVSGGTLYLYSATATNTGTLQATGGGTLTIYNSTVTNTGGTISTDSSSSVVIADSIVTGGNLISSGSAEIHVQNSYLGGVTITSGSTLSSDPGYNTLLTSSITNDGSLLIGSSAGAGYLYVTTNLTIGGTGAVTLNNAASYIRADGYGGTGTTLTNPSTIQGQGYIYDVNLANSGTVNANVSGGTLSLYEMTASNSGTLQATGGGTLYIYDSTVTNTSTAAIATDASSSVVISDSTVTGGNLTSSGSAEIHLENSNIGGVTITSGSTVSSDAGYNNFLTSSITNNGSILIGNSTGAGYLYVTTNLTIGGTGVTTLNNANSYIRADGYGGTGVTLTNPSTIQGQGYIYDVNLANSGTVNANVSGGTLSLYDMTASNSGTLQATGGGTLYIYDSTVTNTSSGTISTDSSSSVLISDSTVTGGNLTSAGSAEIHLESSDIGGVTITSGSTVSSDPGYNNFLTSSITNNGSILIGSGAGAGTVYVTTNLTLGGSGVTTLDNANSYIRADGYGGQGVTLTNQNTINGQGFIYDITLTNQGTVDANVSGGTLSIYDAVVNNSGVLRADAGATLDLTTSTLNNFASTGATAGTLTGGTYAVYSGTLAFNNGGFTNDIVTNAATILLDGTAGAPKLLDQSGHNALANFAVNAAAGSFTIQNGVSFTTASTGFSNAGIVTIGANSTLTVGGANDYVQSGGTTTLLTGTSNLVVASGHAFDLNGGTLQGIGILTGNLVNNGGTVLPGSASSIGTLTVTGNYDPPSISALDINIDIHGSSILDIGGTANISGTTLDVSLLNGFTPMNGASYLIMETGGLTGTFTDPVIVDGNITFTENNVGNNVYLNVSVASIPEPASWLMLALGTAVVGTTCAVRRRRALARQSA
jgi:fibronectin-binding autotransporter adhesin